MNDNDNNIILIGMPGAGKSTVGVILAKRLGFNFIDTDLIIQAREKARLQEIIDAHGIHYFRHIEEEMLLHLNMEHCVIATGGSVVYSASGTAGLKRSGLLVYLAVPLDDLEQRILDMGQRGLVMEQGQTFAQLFQERTPLYELYADLTIDCSGLNAEQVAAAAEEAIRSSWSELTGDTEP
ncbi:MAG: shikimate kinase [Desulfuromonas sp.]|nr:MAG: shikimate kinase [Desulfuromonas sp.]